MGKAGPARSGKRIGSGAELRVSSTFPLCSQSEVEGRTPTSFKRVRYGVVDALGKVAGVTKWRKAAKRCSPCSSLSQQTQRLSRMSLKTPMWHWQKLSRLRRVFCAAPAAALARRVGAGAGRNGSAHQASHAGGRRAARADEAVARIESLQSEDQRQLLDVLLRTLQSQTLP